jgi:hypothetical protein
MILIFKFLNPTNNGSDIKKYVYSCDDSYTELATILANHTLIAYIFIFKTYCILHIAIAPLYAVCIRSK